MENNNHNRRLGTLTAGLTLVGAGIVLLLSLFFPSWNVLAVASKLWPLILILLGSEFLFCRFAPADQAPRVDVAAILITLLCLLFSFFFAAAYLWLSFYWHNL